jgi:hypothetical protein
MEQIVTAALLGIISVVTLSGNILVVVLFIKKRDWLKNAHTCLLLALAIQDIITAITLLVLPGFALPADVYDLPAHPKLRELYCSFVWSWYVPFALSVVSIYTCLMLAIDRLLAVWKPSRYKRFCSSAKVIATMVILPWIAGFGIETRTALNAQSSREDNGSYVCKRVQVDGSPENMMTTLLLFIAKGLLPEVLMTIAYGKMMITIKQSSVRVSCNTTGASHPSRQEIKFYLALRRITRMVCAASALVVICWLPDQIYYCLFELNLIQMDNSIHNGLHILAFLNTSLNPVLYSFYNKQYKDEFKIILCSLFRRNACTKTKDTCTDHN